MSEELVHEGGFAKEAQDIVMGGIESIQSAIDSREISPDQVVEMLKAKLPKLITIQEDTNSSTNSLPLREQLVELFNTIDEGRFVSLKRVSQKTIDKLRYGKGGGRMLSTVMLVLSQLGFNLKIRLKSKSTTIYLDINIGNEAIFCSNYFKNCRGIAGITATYLDQELANLKGKGGNNDGYTSKVETIKHKKGVTVETLENVATICGLEATFEYKQ